MVKRIPIFIIGFLLIPTLSIGQEVKIKTDTSYIESHRKLFHVTLSLNHKRHGIRISDNDFDKFVLFRPNIGPNVGIGIDYRIVSFEYTRSIQNKLVYDESKGLSKASSFKFGITGNRIVGVISLQIYNGLYVHNANKLIDGWDKDQQGYPVSNNIGSLAMMASLNYYFNHSKFSNIASYTLIERQKKSAGSIATGILFRGNLLVSDSSIFPAELQAKVSAENNIKSIANSTIGLNFGYAYTYVYKSWFANASIIPGINLQSGSVIIANNQANDFQSKMGFHGDFRICSGYNGDHLYTGASYTNYILFHSLHNERTISSNTLYLRVFVGYRFHL